MSRLWTRDVNQRTARTDRATLFNVLFRMVHSKRLQLSAQDRRSAVDGAMEALDWAEGPCLVHRALPALTDTSESDTDNSDFGSDLMGSSSEDEQEDFEMFDQDVENEDFIELAMQSISASCSKRAHAILAMREALWGFEPQSQAQGFASAHFNAFDFAHGDFRDNFRWHEPADVQTLVEALQIPEEITLPNRSKITGEEGLLCLLHRLGSGGVLQSNKRVLPWIPSRISMAFNHMCHWLNDKHWNKLFNSCMSLSTRFPLYQQFIHQKTEIDLPVIGFLDGTGRACARSGDSEVQNANHNGYYGGDVLKWHGVQVSRTV